MNFCSCGEPPYQPYFLLLVSFRYTQPLDCFYGFDARRNPITIRHWFVSNEAWDLTQRWVPHYCCSVFNRLHPSRRLRSTADKKNITKKTSNTNVFIIFFLQGAFIHIKILTLWAWVWSHPIQRQQIYPKWDLTRRACEHDSTLQILISSSKIMLYYKQNFMHIHSLPQNCHIWSYFSWTIIVSLLGSS